MADVGPDWQVAQQKARYDLANQRAKVEQYKHELLQMNSQRQKTIDNIKASEQAIEDAQKRLDGLIEAHGEMPLMSFD
jgi:outer membrane protein TolC